MTKKDEIINYILNKIETNEWKSGDKILSKYQLASFFNVSQNTAQTSVRELIIKGILESRHGSGVYVKEKKKNIIITFHEKILYFDIYKFYRETLQNIEKKLIGMGYNVILNPEKPNTKNDIIHSKPIISNELNLNEIAGVISIKGNIDLLHYFHNHNIPVIGSELCEYPNVNINLTDLYKKTLRLTDKYLGHNPLFLEYSFTKNYHDIIISFYSQLKEKYNFKIINLTNEKITYQLDNFFNNLQETPTGIVFTDNTIYTNVLPLIEKYDNIFKNTKIITHSNGYEYFPENYKICRIQFNINEFCDNIISILLKLMNKEFALKYSYRLKGEIINEELIK